MHTSAKNEEDDRPTDRAPAPPDFAALDALADEHEQLGIGATILPHTSEQPKDKSSGNNNPWKKG